MQHRVEQHRGVPVGQHEAIAVRPDRILGIEAQKVLPQRVSHRRHRHRRAGMARIGLLHRIHREVRMVLMQSSSIEDAVVMVGHPPKLASAQIRGAARVPATLRSPLDTENDETASASCDDGAGPSDLRAAFLRANDRDRDLLGPHRESCGGASLLAELGASTADPRSPAIPRVPAARSARFATHQLQDPDGRPGEPPGSVDDAQGGAEIFRGQHQPDARPLCSGRRRRWPSCARRGWRA